MAKVRVFLSFDFDRDEELHRSFYAQAEPDKDNSRHAIEDYSLNEAYSPSENWLNKARNKIKRSDIVIVVVGDDTHSSDGVKKEVEIAKQLRKPMFQIRPQKRTAGKVKGAREMIRWDWDLIDAKIDELLLKQNKRRGNRSRANRAKSRQRS